MTIRKNDHVRVITGKDRGKEGRVLFVLPEKRRVSVEGVNLVKRHTKITAARGRGGQEGGIVTREATLDVSNVQLVCSACGPTRVAAHIAADGTKSRVCRKCGTEL